jgi:hypothetical protein
VEAGENGGSVARWLDLLSWPAVEAGRGDLERIFFYAYLAGAVLGAEGFPPLLDLDVVVVVVMVGIWVA